MLGAATAAIALPKPEPDVVAYIQRRMEAALPEFRAYLMRAGDTLSVSVSNAPSFSPVGLLTLAPTDGTPAVVVPMPSHHQEGKEFFHAEREYVIQKMTWRTSYASGNVPITIERSGK